MNRESSRAVLVFVALSVLVATPNGLRGEIDPEYKNYAPVFSPDGERIAFYGNRGGNWDIFIINSNGHDLFRVTDEPGYDGEPSWSPDGSKIVFTSDRDGDTEIYTMAIDGAALTQITHNDRGDGDPIWSPSGDRIVFVTQIEDRWLVHAMRPDGTNQVPLSEIAAQGRLRWSPDGAEITYAVDVEGQAGIPRMAADGRSIAILFPGHGLVGNPHLSTDGGKILFDAHADGADSSGDGKWELWTVRSDGSDVTRLTHDGRDDWGGFWSSDGQRIVYCGGGLDNTGYEIFIRDADGSGPIQLTHR